MIKHFQLIAVASIFFGLLLFGTGVYLLAKENLTPSPTVLSENPTPPPVAANIAKKTKPNPTPSPQTIAEPTAAPVKRPPSSVQWIKRDSYLGGKKPVFTALPYS